jgi:phosphatidylserine/phosphatidylglycerophosphate/cardiolipin synthase-like enzyme
MKKTTLHIVTNAVESKNHFALLRTLAAGASELIIFSPFLAPDLDRVLAKLSLTGLTKFRVVTTMPAHSAAQLWNLRAMESTQRFFDVVRPDVELRIEIAADLHGKVYFFKDEGVAFAAIITSANFTDNGLRRNAEWGVAIRDPDQ